MAYLRHLRIILMMKHASQGPTQGDSTKSTDVLQMLKRQGEEDVKNVQTGSEVKGKQQPR